MRTPEIFVEEFVTMKVPLFKIYWDEDDLRLTNEAITRGMYWTTGPNTTEFEKLIADYVGCRFCLVFNSGTSALHAVIMAYGIGRGDEVIVPSFTFVATANAAIFNGARPVFADIEELTLGLDPKDVESRITSRTKAILPIHYAGCPCMIDKLRQIAAEHHLLLIEDAAEAFGSQYADKKVGTFGNAAVLSFCQNKIITTGEGGAVVTDDGQVYEKLKLIRSHGRLDTADYFASPEYMDYVALGYNFRLSDISAALGISQIRKVDKIISMRRANASLMDRALSGVGAISTPQRLDGYFHVYQMYSIRVKSGRGLRDQVTRQLTDDQIACKVNFSPIHLTKFYRESFGHHRGELPVTEMISEQILTLPMYPSMTEAEVSWVADCVKRAVN